MKKIVRCKQLSKYDKDPKFIRWYLRAYSGESFMCTEATAGFDPEAISEGLSVMVEYFQKEKDGKTYLNALAVSDAESMTDMQKVISLLEDISLKLDSIAKANLHASGSLEDELFGGKSST